MRAAAVHTSIVFSLKNKQRRPCEIFEFSERAQDPLAPECMTASTFGSMTIMVYPDRIAFMQRKAGKAEVIQNIGIFRFTDLDFTAKEVFGAIKANKRSFASNVIASTKYMDQKYYACY
jgi:hypothetical protein